MLETNRDLRPISETEGEDRKIRDRDKKRKCKLSEKTRIRKKGKRKFSEQDEDSKTRIQVKKGKRKLSGKHRKKRRLSKKRLETETETEKLDQQPKKDSRKLKKKYCDMTKDEVVNLCFILDRPRARLVVDKLRKYLIQVSESKGFDCDFYPGQFSGVTSVCPVRYCSVNSKLANNVELLAVAGITKYNLANKESEYKVVDVETVNVCVGFQCTYYVTFNAQANDGALKTFQAVVAAHWFPPNESHISDAYLCRPKLSLVDAHH